MSRFLWVAGVIASTSLFTPHLLANEPASRAIKDSSSDAIVKAVGLPPAPAGVTDLSFKEFFKLPIGPTVLEPTEKLLGLNNQRVRIVGFMAQEDDPTPGIFILAGHAVNIGEKADGMADDLPAATLTVHMPNKDASKTLVYNPKPWVLTGTLQLGNQDEPNNRISYARLIMDQRDIDYARQQAPAAPRAKNSPKH